MKTFTILFPASFELIDCGCLLPSGIFLNLGKATVGFHTAGYSWGRPWATWFFHCWCSLPWTFKIPASICSLSFLTGAPAAMLSCVLTDRPLYVGTWNMAKNICQGPCTLHGLTPVHAWLGNPLKEHGSLLPDTGSMQMSARWPKGGEN